MHTLNLRLQTEFLFSNQDLQANRSGQLSDRQKARLKAGGANLRLSLLVFILVMVITLGIIAASSWRAGGFLISSENLLTLLVAGVVITLVVVLGILISYRYLVAMSPRQMYTVQGRAQHGKIKENSAHFEVRIGKTLLRLVTLEQMQAFQPDVEYRVFYLPGPVPTILSAEVVGTEPEAESAAKIEERLPPEPDIVLQRQRQARPVLLVLTLLALGIPLAGFAITSLPDVIRWAAWISLLAIGVGFVFWAVKRVGGE